MTHRLSIPDRAVHWLPRGMCFVAAALFAYQTYSLLSVIGSDMEVFHAAVGRVLRDPALLYHDDLGVMGTAKALLGYLYPPPAIAMLLPFSLGTLEQGHAILSVAALACAVGSVWAWLSLARRHGLFAIGRVETAAIIAMTAVTGAVFTCRYGQVDTLILGIVTAGAWLAFTGRPGIGAAILAAGTWIKIYPAMLMLPLLLARDTRWRAITGFGAGGLAVLAAGLAAFPWSVWTDFAAMLPVMAERTIINIDNQSIAAIWARTTVEPQTALTSYASVVVPAWLRAGDGQKRLAHNCARPGVTPSVTTGSRSPAPD